MIWGYPPHRALPAVFQLVLRGTVTLELALRAATILVAGGANVTPPPDGLKSVTLVHLPNPLSSGPPNKFRDLVAHAFHGKDILNGTPIECTLVRLATKLRLEAP